MNTDTTSETVTHAMVAAAIAAAGLDDDEAVA